MGQFAVADVVMTPFPFSDLSNAKRRPAVLLAEVGRGDWIMCMVTSKPFADPVAVRLDSSDFATGSLPLVSYARPSRLFTANESLIVSVPGQLNAAGHRRVRDAVVKMFGP